MPPSGGRALRVSGFRQLSKALAKTGAFPCTGTQKIHTVFPIPVRLWNFFSVLRRLGGLELELQAVRNQGDKFGVRRFPLGVAHGVAKEALRGIAGIAGEATAPCDCGGNPPGLPQRAAGPYE